MWIYLILFWLLGPGILGQCVDCNAKWHFHCKSEHTGYYCAGNKSVIEKYTLSHEDFATSTEQIIMPFDVCTPYPYILHFAESYCCLYSPKFGCHAALHPSLYKFEKSVGRYCSLCKKHCRCVTDEAAPRHRFWAAVRLLGIVALLSAFLSSLMESTTALSY
ncbi:uncharacterized protein Dana_GF26394 [Drosophila ananassae]|uniref:UPAR/Ly6 domain-containing protein n=1 Tax=Drosophila ananassae TaxID=7217 RepID=A0A0P9C111_DROAN|nr:uncharacterized protein LOC26513803 [Drosophila ananassae]KPU77291.1 uncharacterized protein Dana_GF26394 [Drosophila ananassae]